MPGEVAFVRPEKASDASVGALAQGGEDSPPGGVASFVQEPGKDVERSAGAGDVLSPSGARVDAAAGAASGGASSSRKGRPKAETSPRDAVGGITDEPTMPAFADSEPAAVAKATLSSSNRPTRRPPPVRRMGGRAGKGVASRLGGRQLSSPEVGGVPAVARAIRRIRGALTDVGFSHLCAELEAQDRDRSGTVGWCEFGQAVSRLLPGTPAQSMGDVEALLAGAGLRLRPGRRVQYLAFFDRVVPTLDEAQLVAAGACDPLDVINGGVAVARAVRAQAAMHGAVAVATGPGQISASSRQVAAEVATPRARGGGSKGAADGGGGGGAAGGSGGHGPPRGVVGTGTGADWVISDMQAIVKAALEGEDATSIDVEHGGSEKRSDLPGLGAGSKRVASLQAKEEAVRARLRLLADKPVPVTATDVVSLMRIRAVRSSTQRAFRSMDADGNGVLDAEEIRMALRRLKLDLPPSQARALVAAIDVNGDGLVQWDEWVAFVNDRHREGVAQREVSASAGDPSGRRNNPPPPGATATGNRRGLVRAADATVALRSIVDKAPHMVRTAVAPINHHGGARGAWG